MIIVIINEIYIVQVRKLQRNWEMLPQIRDVEQISFQFVSEYSLWLQLLMVCITVQLRLKKS